MRYYDPASGQFISRDPYAGQLGNPLSQNRSAYAEDNPTTLIDPMGLSVAQDMACSLRDYTAGLPTPFEGLAEAKAKLVAFLSRMCAGDLPSFKELAGRLHEAATSPCGSFFIGLFETAISFNPNWWLYTVAISTFYVANDYIQRNDPDTAKNWGPDSLNLVGNLGAGLGVALRTKYDYTSHPYRTSAGPLISQITSLYSTAHYGYTCGRSKGLW